MFCGVALGWEVMHADGLSVQARHRAALRRRAAFVSRKNVFQSLLDFSTLIHVSREANANTRGSILCLKLHVREEDGDP